MKWVTVINQYYAFLHQNIWETWNQGVQLERAASRTARAAFFVASEGEERLDEDTEEFWNEDEWDLCWDYLKWLITL